VPCTNLNGSGTLVPIELFLQLGGLDEALFIDHVDTEWSFRVLAADLGLRGIPAAVFKHRMGQSSVRYWLLGWRIWPSRSPQRHYFLFRNAVLLMRRPYVPRVWKFWAVVKLALTAIMHGLFDRERRAQWRQMRQGVREGLRVTSTPPSCRMQ
jgi:rhamnosyltransferase